MTALRPRVLGLALLLGIIASPAARAFELTGTWEVQTMDAYRTVKIEQRGHTLIAHRVMWPEFEGKQYRLEHLYRGHIQGNSLTGKLLVKEDQQAHFEVLRDFSGHIDNDNRITIDELPMLRTGKPAAPAVAGASVPAKGQASRTASSSAGAPSSAAASGAAVAQTSPPPPPPLPPAPPPERAAPSRPASRTKPTHTASTTPAPKKGTESSTTLFQNIMGSPGMSQLFTVAKRVVIPDAAADHTAAGDKLYAAKHFARALAQYKQAEAVHGASTASLLPRLGRCQLALGHYSKARRFLGRALRLDPNNKTLRRDYHRAAAHAPHHR